MSQPVIILPKGNMTDADIELLRVNGICVVESADPSAVEFTNPSEERYGAIALKIIRVMINHDNANNYWTCAQVGKWWAKLLLAESA